MKSPQDVDGLTISRRPTEAGIEGIRGIAAIFVALSHVLYLKLLAPDLQMNPYLMHVEAGHAGVLVFFVLSGYVISWTNTASFSRNSAQAYLYRRFVRLFPIYFLAMLVTVLAIRMSGLHEPPRVIIGSFLCLQNFNGYFGPALNPPRVNGALWSLNYEVLYYAVFLLLWRFRPSFLWVSVPAFLMGVVCWVAPAFMPLFIASYACGWVLWSAGWWLAARPGLDASPHCPTPLATWILLIFANQNINGIARISNALHIYSQDAGMVNIADLGSLPAILLAMAAVTHRTLRFRTWIIVSAWAVCLLPIAGMIWTGRLLSHPDWVVGTASVALAALLSGWHSERWIRRFAWFGSISYAFYVVHFPLLYLVRLAPFSGVTLEGFFERLVLWLTAALCLSWLLERRLQPWIRSLLLPGRQSPR